MKKPILIAALLVAAGGGLGAAPARADAPDIRVVIGIPGVTPAHWWKGDRRRPLSWGEICHRLDRAGYRRPSLYARHDDVYLVIASRGPRTVYIEIDVYSGRIERVSHDRPRSWGRGWGRDGHHDRDGWHRDRRHGDDRDDRD